MFMPTLLAEATAIGLADRLRGLVGIVVILGLLILFSEHRRAISRRVVFWGLALQWGFAFIVLKWNQGAMAIKKAGDVVQGVLESAVVGSRFVFGDKLLDPAGPAGFVFAFHILPTVIFVAAFFAVLYHLGIMQWVVRGVAAVMAKLMGASGAESLDVAASIFIGQTEAPLTIRPYLPKMTRSELLTVMTSGMAHVSGGIMAAYVACHVELRHILTAVIMTAPGTILVAKLMIPETETPETLGHVKPSEEKPDANVLDAASRGTREGLALALNIAAMLIAFLAIIHLINTGLGLFGGWIERMAGTHHGLETLSLQSILGVVLAPVAWLLGIPLAD
ncbi:MAG TPA: nucleoside transporter C-terminal domain-containing protein, partial [Isosphaeraceae bacterium]